MVPLPNDTSRRQWRRQWRRRHLTDGSRSPKILFAAVAKFLLVALLVWLYVASCLSSLSRANGKRPSAGVDTRGGIENRGRLSPDVGTNSHHSTALDGNSGALLTLQLQINPPMSIRLRLYRHESPDAFRFLRELTASLGGIDFGGCEMYRAEPVPDFWGNESMPDTYFGGRWGPPYALIQGKFSAEGSRGGNQGGTMAPIRNAAAEDHRPVIRRGHVSWAGGRGGPHFFVALADHPEWKTSHTVWAEVVVGDMTKLDSLVKMRELKTIKPKLPPTLSYFVDPIPFTMTMHDS